MRRLKGVRVDDVNGCVGTLYCNVIDGTLTNPMADEVGIADLPIGKSTQLRGWGELDGPAHYVGSHWVIPDSELARVGICRF